MASFDLEGVALIRNASELRLNKRWFLLILCALRTAVRKQELSKNLSQMKEICKSLHIKERHLRNKRKRPRKLCEPIWYKVDPDDSRQLILKNGTRIRQGFDNVDLFCSKGGKVYSLTKFGLRPIRVDYCKKSNYGKLSRNGVVNGPIYPYVNFRGGTYRVHSLVLFAWKGKRKKNKQADHITGNIHDFRLKNLRYIDVAENYRCGGILRRLRHAAIKHNLPFMDPAKRESEDLLRVFRRFKKIGADQALQEDIERQKVLQKLRESAVFLRDPSLDPKNIEPERLEQILSTIRVDDSKDIMEYEMTHHMEI